ncbi:MAG: hypothetical protein EPO46_09705 [Lysobacter sp.]|nr:MAG: hypothetical protein EPO46_09705 [Lysobacter sp.]
MEQNEWVAGVAQVVGQAIGEVSVGVAMSVLALTHAVSQQPGIDRDRLFADMLDGLPQGEGVAHNAIDVIRHALEKALSEGAPPTV